MKRVFLVIAGCFVIHLLYAEYIMLDSLRLCNNYTHMQKVIVHTGKSTDASNYNVTVHEFTINDTLYIISSLINSIYRDFSQNVSSVDSLMLKLRALYYDEGDCYGKNCGYMLVYDGYTPTTLTLYSNLDTIQYTTTPTPQLYAAVIRDTIYGLPTLKCGMPINKILTDLEINGSYYDYDKYKHIVLIPLLTYFQRTECINLPDACFVLENKNGILNKVEYRQFDYSGSGIVQELLLY